MKLQNTTLFISLVNAASVFKHDSNPTEKLNLFLTGDWGGDVCENCFTTKYSEGVGSSMNHWAGKLDLDAILSLGDNFYDNGVISSDDARFEQTYLEVFKGEFLKETPFYVVAGNHDYHQNVTAQIEYTKKDPTKRWNYPDWWYTKTFLEGKVEILFLDTSVLKGKSQWNAPAFSQKSTLSSDKNEPTPDEKREAHYQWIEETLRASTAEILIVVGHYPVYSAGPHGSTKELYTNLQPLLENYNVTAYFSGHDHLMQHINYQETTQQYFVFGMATVPDVLPLEECGQGCDVTWFYDYDESTTVGAFGMLKIVENDDNSIKATVSVVNADSNEVMYNVELESRVRNQ